MRTIQIPAEVVQLAAHGPIKGARLEFVAQVDWPELRLTEQQQLENVLARLSGQPAPHDDPQVFSVYVPYLPSAAGVPETPQAIDAVARGFTDQAGPPTRAKGSFRG